MPFRKAGGNYRTLPFYGWQTTNNAVKKEIQMKTALTQTMAKI